MFRRVAEQQTRPDPSNNSSSSSKSRNATETNASDDGDGGDSAGRGGNDEESQDDGVSVRVTRQRKVQDSKVIVIEDNDDDNDNDDDDDDDDDDDGDGKRTPPNHCAQCERRVRKGQVLCFQCLKGRSTPDSSSSNSNSSSSNSNRGRGTGRASKRGSLAPAGKQNASRRSSQANNNNNNNNNNNKSKRAASGSLLHELRGGSLLSLQDLCVRFVVKHIDCVSDFGDVADEALDRICAVICKQNKLTDDTLKLFATAQRHHLQLFDCANLTPQSYHDIFVTCGALSSLTLDLCGQLDDDVRWPLAHVLVFML